MSKVDYQSALKIIESNTEKIFIKFPQFDKSIELAQNLLGIKFPKTYIDFQSKYGSFGFGSQDIFGLTKDTHLKDSYMHGNCVHMTLDNRKNQSNLQFPGGFLVIHELGNGELSCLDTSRMNNQGECPVVAWYFGAIEDIAEDFGAFLLEKVQVAISEV